MNYTKLKKTGIKISKIGFGTWGISGDWGKRFSKKEIFDLFTTAYDLGINFFDTAPVYGNGRIERILGKFSKKNDIVIATKIPAMKKPSLFKEVDIGECYDINYIDKMLSCSLRRLNKDCIDLLMLHNWHPKWNKTGDWIFQYLDKIKSKGKVKVIGVSLPNWMNAGLEGVSNLGLLDFIMTPLSLLQQWPIKFILPFVKKYRISVLARSVFDHGSLCGRLDEIDRLPKKHILKRKLNDDKLIEREKIIDKICKSLSLSDKELIPFSMQFCLNQTGVDSLVLGMESEKEIKANVENLKIKFSKTQLEKARQILR